MTGRLPFTLTPLEGEPFEAWLHAYAARLTLAPRHLAEALGLPPGSGTGQHTTPPAQRLASICAAAGLPSATVAAMSANSHWPSPRLLGTWMPQRVTRFCPDCLAEEPTRLPTAWSLPVTFFCVRHSQLLASTCPPCGRRPASTPLPGHQPAHCARCGGRLDKASAPACADVAAACRAQQGINQMLTGVRDAGATADQRHQALAGLTDLAIIAFHLATAC